MGGFRLGLLGIPRLLAGGLELRFPDRRSIALLAVLALDGRLTRARLAALLWDEQADHDARRNLRRELHRMKEAGLDAAIEAASDTLALSSAVDLDTAQFEAASQAGSPEPALALYNGGLLKGFELGGAPAFSDWLAARREGFAQRWRAIAESHCEALQRQGDLRGALRESARLLADDTLQEGHYRRVMALHHRLGEREAALDVFERCRKALGRELGLRPLPETIELAERIRSGAAAGPTTAPVETARRFDALPPVPALVGRDPVIARLRSMLAGQRLTLLEGPAGIGKSRLLRTLADDGEPICIHASRVSDARVPFAALVRWLRAGRATAVPSQPAAGLAAWVSTELARLLPELGPAPAALSSDTQRVRLYEAVRVAWEAWFGHARVQAFDDWQFVDEGSAQWWGWWQGQLPQGQALLVALRPDEVGGEAAGVLRDVARSVAASTLQLGPLDESAMLQLVRQLSGSDHPERFSHRLWRATGGNPFFAYETLAHLIDTQVIRIDERGRWTTPYDDATDDYRELPIPPSVHAAVAARVRSLGEAAQRLLEAASLIGDDFDLGLASGASALGEWEAVQAIEAALRARIVRRHGEAPALYRFEHDLIAQTLQAGLSPERRELVHRSLGARLAQLGAPPARVAEHFERGGDVVAACRWHLLALGAARRSFVLGDMLAEADSVLRLQPTAAQATAAHLARADALRHRAEPADAVAALADAQALLRADDPASLHVSVMETRASHAVRSGDPESALAPIAALLADPRLSGHERARLRVSRADCLRPLGRLLESKADLAFALDAFDADAALERGLLLNDMARSCYLQGEYDEAQGHGRASIAALQSVDHAAGLASAFTVTGACALSRGELPGALADLSRAQEIAQRAGLIALERGAILNLVAALHGLGDYDRAAGLLEHGYRLSRLFSSLAEQHAFIEARHVCQLIAGDLDGALDAWHELVAFSQGVGDAHRRLSGLLVAADLPLLLGDVDTAGPVVAAAAALVESTEVMSLAAQIRAKTGWLKTLQGDPAGALHELASVACPADQRPEDRCYLAAVATLAHLQLGDLDAASESLHVEREGTTPEVWSLLRTAGIRCDDARGTVAEATVGGAFDELDSGSIPPLHALELLGALDDAALLETARGAPWRERAAAIAGRLHAGLVRHERTRSIFERRYARWLDVPDATNLR